LILTTTVNNSVASTGYSSNQYACENTNDKVFLLSYAEVTNSSYGFSSSYSNYDEARRMTTSDYSRATGVDMDTSSSYYGNGNWWLRSPYPYDSDTARYVNHNGPVDYNSHYGYDITGSYVYNTSSGVVPAMWIELE
ncbi:MAG: hypothetical protein J6A99_03225, partial [Clostridia bacterium]|nr:hypothetical protein [Clostridia bacterium]